MITFETGLLYVACYFGLFVSVFYLLMFMETRKKLKSPRGKKLPRISVIIPAHNEERVIERTIRSVLNLDYPRNKLEIIVVDDGSTDRTYEIAKKYESKTIKVFKKKREGKASALNFGIKKCSNDFILTLDADCFPKKDVLKKMVGYFEDPRIMSVVPVLSVWKPKSLIEKMQVVEYAIVSFIRKLSTFIHSLNVAPGASLYRKRFFKRYGGFDENNLTEDLEMGMRIQSKNYRIAYALDTCVYTIVPKTFKDLMRQRIRWNYGTLENLKKYSFMFGLRYGDLGIFFLPVMAVGMGLSIILLVYYSALILWNVFHSLYLFSLIGYDFSYIISSIRLDEIIDTLLSTRVFLFVILFLVGLTIYALAKKSLKKGKFKLEFLAYTIIYGWILILFQFLGLVYFLSRRRPRW